ncbi:MAG TPA: hypothetical protein DCK99_12735 [Blastocatellia bacterium]|nr:hypothetical protein [Blastocatellia bacterium]
MPSPTFIEVFSDFITGLNKVKEKRPRIQNRERWHPDNKFKLASLLATGDRIEKVTGLFDFF